ncbi:hypothetical protein EDEG_00584 [Edhazardia aedis USNM 41457]|uniref:Uncharacterized protein n=1 Tax=Edhazardia aedis (strain USNM 41457) TaxID=1003232 RepID=J9A0B7_EDHAE|nr:hypothetical protein EDEG_00584 [Edhazardia aedis USNM 41457]|eukprot:EJW05358.1 hypothetical protein EDEG_00584 [Edhazardia aedis USNM 41457]
MIITFFIVEFNARYFDIPETMSSWSLGANPEDFNEQIMRNRHTEKPIIFPSENKVQKSEATTKEEIDDAKELEVFLGSCKINDFDVPMINTLLKDEIINTHSKNISETIRSYTNILYILLKGRLDFLNINNRLAIKAMVDNIYKDLESYGADLLENVVTSITLIFREATKQCQIELNNNSDLYDIVVKYSGSTDDLEFMYGQNIAQDLKYLFETIDKHVKNFQETSIAEYNVSVKTEVSNIIAQFNKTFKKVDDYDVKKNFKADIQNTFRYFIDDFVFSCNEIKNLTLAMIKNLENQKSLLNFSHSNEKQKILDICEDLRKTIIIKLENMNDKLELFFRKTVDGLQIEFTKKFNSVHDSFLYNIIKLLCEQNNILNEMTENLFKLKVDQ